MKRYLILVGWLFVSLANAMPTILVIQEFKPPTESGDPNVALVDLVAASLVDTGKFDAIAYSPRSEPIKQASGKLKLIEPPAKPDVQTAIRFAQMLGAEYVVTVKAFNSGDILTVTAHLFVTRGGKAIWSHDRGYRQQQTDARAPANAPASAARTIAFAIATDPLKDVKVSRPSSEDPQALLPDAAARPKTVERQSDSLDPGLEALREGRWGDAVCLLREAVDGAPMNAAARAALAETYLGMGRVDAAVDECKRARRLLPKDTGLEAVYARALAKAGKPEDAQGVYQELVKAIPNDPAGYLGLGDAFAAAGNFAHALDQYETARRKAPADPTIALRVTEMLIALRRYADAGKQYGEVHSMGVADDIEKRARYRRLAKRLDDALNRIADDVGSVRQEAHAPAASKETMEAKVTALVAEAKSLGDLCDRITSPPAYLESRQGRSLAANLLAQATLALKRFVDTGRTESLDDAALFRSDAVRELKAAAAKTEDVSGASASPS